MRPLAMLEGSNQTALKISDCFVKLLVYCFTNIYAARTLRS